MTRLSTLLNSVRTAFTPNDAATAPTRKPAMPAPIPVQPIRSVPRSYLSGTTIDRRPNDMPLAALPRVPQASTSKTTRPWIQPQPRNQRGRKH